MIQRIQTLFLALVATTSILLFFLPLAGFLSELYYFKLYLYQLKNLTPDSDIHFGFTTVLPLILINSGIVIIVVYTIFKYKNRILQIRLVRFAILLTIFLIAGILFLYPMMVEKRTGASADFDWGAYLPLINLLFLFLANNYILKDERLVRSVDRLR